MDNSPSIYYAIQTRGVPHRHVPGHLGINRFSNATKFISRFYPREWKTFTLTNPIFYLVEESFNESTPVYSFDKAFAELVTNCLLKVSREVCCLISGQSPMVSPGSTFTFDTNLLSVRLQEVGGFPVYLADVNREVPDYNLLNGAYPYNDALIHCQVLQDLGKKIVMFIDRAYNLKGNQNRYADGWNFGEVLTPATDFFLNACVPGNAKVFEPEETNDMDSILSDDEHLSQDSPVSHELRDISSPALKPVTPVSSPSEETSSRFSDEFLKNFHAFYNENSDEAKVNDKISAVNAVNTDKSGSTVVNDQVNCPVQDTSTNFVKAQVIPDIKGNSKENPDTPLDTNLLESDGNEVSCRALIPHPIYGRNAQNSLVKYNPFYPNLFSDN
jgi:hypothetical protein